MPEAASAGAQPLWQPSPERVATANLTAFAAQMAKAHGVNLADFGSCGAGRSIIPSAFWTAVWDVLRRDRRDARQARAGDADQMPGARFFPRGEAQLRARTCCAGTTTTPALVFWGEDKVKRRVSWAELHAEVSRLAAGARGGGRRVRATASPAIMPNMPEAIVAMLAAASLGAVWSSCSPDFGVQGVFDRFGQIEPKVLFAVDGYHYNGKTHRLPRQAARDRAAPADARARSWSCPMPAAKPVARRPRERGAAVGLHSRRTRRGPIDFARCRSTIRSTSSTRRARPACRNASCTAPAARCSST